jgi:N6-L-threonylcarbamoyladenine synthase
MKILGIETSCDETAAAVVSDEPPFIRSNVVFAQIAEHRPFGGIVPEIAPSPRPGSACAISMRWRRPAGLGSSAASSSG